MHYPVLNQEQQTTTTSVTILDIHDFARSCGFYGVGPVYIVHPADAMRSLVTDVRDYWISGAGAGRNPARRQVMEMIRVVDSVHAILQEENYQLWYTSAGTEGQAVEVSGLRGLPGNHLIVFGTGSGLDVENMPKPNGWLSAIKGEGKVRHLSVRAALAIYLDRLVR